MFNKAKKGSRISESINNWDNCSWRLDSLKAIQPTEDRHPFSQIRLTECPNSKTVDGKHPTHFQTTVQPIRLNSQQYEKPIITFNLNSSSTSLSGPAVFRPNLSLNEISNNIWSNTAADCLTPINNVAPLKKVRIATRPRPGTKRKTKWSNREQPAYLEKLLPQSCIKRLISSSCAALFGSRTNTTTPGQPLDKTTNQSTQQHVKRSIMNMITDNRAQWGWQPLLASNLYPPIAIPPPYLTLSGRRGAFSFSIKKQIPGSNCQELH